MIKYLKNFSVQKKIGVVAATSIGMFFIAIIVSFICLTMVGGTMKDFYDRPFVNSNTQMEIRRHMHYIGKTVLLGIVTDDENLRNQRIEEADKTMDEMEAAMDRLQKTFLDKNLLKEVDTIYTKFKESHKQMEALLMANHRAEARTLLEGEYMTLTVQLQDILKDVGTIANNNAEIAYSSSRRTTLIAYISLLSISLLAILVSIVLIKQLGKLIMSPIDELKNVASDIAQGKLEVTIDYESNDELGQLAESFRKTCEFLKGIINDLSKIIEELKNGNYNVKSQNRGFYIGDFKSILLDIQEMKKKQSSVMRKISEASQQVSLGSEHMATSAQSLAEGATEQAGAVQQLTATIENITTITEQNSEEALKSYESSEQYLAMAETSRKQMEELYNSMEHIDAASRQIETIIVEIEDIASQTNLLSLNASIEAARAGEAGRGFSVVAAQISKLASDSADSAGRTRDLIMKSLEEVDNGNIITKRAQEGLADIINGIDVLANATKQSSENFKSQVSTMLEIERGIEQISMVVQNNSAEAQQTSSTSEELSAQANTLNDLMRQFNLLEEE